MGDYKTYQTYKTLGIKKLESSGLDEGDAERLHIKFLRASQPPLLQPGFRELPALKIEYYGPDGEPLSDWSSAPDFYRLRYLESEDPSFANLGKKEVRYVQPPHTAPVAYYPQNVDNWVDICNDPNHPLLITEGELKAAKASKEGFPCVGIGGVWNWRAVKLGLMWLPSLEPIDFKRRNVYIVFDSDYRENKNVCGALKVFAEELQSRGAFPHVVSLPDLPGQSKIGLDDFLVHETNSVDALRALLRFAEPLGLAKPLFELNDRYAYIRNPGMIIDRVNIKNKVSPGAFKDHLESTSSYVKRSLNPDGSIQYTSSSASANWLKWPLRTEAEKLTYSPGEPEFSGDNYNTWKGWGVEPKKGDIKLFNTLIDHIFSGAEPEAKKWFLQWLAYPLQHPGTKLFSTAVIHGVAQGTGKSLIGYIMGVIYGDNFTEINQMDLHNHFNEWAECKQFILGDDVTGTNKRADADFLKKLITQKKIRINGKYTPIYEVPDCVNYLFTSQHGDSFFLEDGDRRFFVHEVTAAPLSDEFYEEFDKWLWKGSAASNIFHYLLELDLTGFNPRAKAYKTSAKDRMIVSGRSDLASWVRELIDTPDVVLKVGSVKIEQDLLTSKELLTLYDPLGNTGTTANGLARELRRAGVHQVQNGNPIKLSDGSQSRFFAIRNAGKWLSAGAVAIRKHVEGQPKKSSPSKGKY